MKSVSVVIVAGGSGRRMGGSIPKQFLTLHPSGNEAGGIYDEVIEGGGTLRQREGIGASDVNVGHIGLGFGESALGATVVQDKTPTARRCICEKGATVLEITLRRFLDALPGCEIVVVLPANEISRWEDICRTRALAGTHLICAGGETRFESVRNGIRALGPCEFIAVHDGVRPLVTVQLILRCIGTARECGTAVPAVRPADSFRKVEEGGGNHPVDRDILRAVQTPQVFREGILRHAYETEYDVAFTDDASVVEASGVEVTLCEGDRENIKITTPEDLIVARAVLFEQLRHWYN